MYLEIFYLVFWVSSASCWKSSAGSGWSSCCSLVTVGSCNHRLSIQNCVSDSTINLQQIQVYGVSIAVANCSGNILLLLRWFLFAGDHNSMHDANLIGCHWLFTEYELVARTRERGVQHTSNETLCSCLKLNFAESCYNLKLNAAEIY